MDAVKIPCIKGDAIVDIRLGAQIIGDLQEVLIFLTTGKTSDTIKQKLQNKQELDSSEKSIITISKLLQNITKIAQDKNLIEYRNLEDTLSL